MTKPKAVINITFPSSLLGLVFILLKVTETVTWSWPIVLMPFWLPWAFIATFVAMMAAVALVAAIMAGVSYFIKSTRRRF